ncbi:hypothetical protein EDD37DRAFT_651254 [Exophiala viscosa]|uniref:uncharacterized protein n=1 Tax=Exophiala viscosa TaxID=2486360 RepID=UPI002199985B|nr:hypothetical protein EDD37DRAFT_651254 [Exophiala viscosa]
MATKQPDHHPIIQSFRKWVDDNSVPGTLGDTEKPNTQFMIGSRLETYLKDASNTRNLLRALWDSEDPPLQSQDILGKCSKGFAILLLIGMGKYIQYFVQYDSLWDGHMPFDRESPPAKFPTTDMCPDFFQRFVERQWQFFSHHFHNSVDIHLAPERILPIKSKVLIGTGGFADLYKITVHTAYDGLTPGRDPGRDANKGFTNTYVLKTYRTQDAELHYSNEINAFQRLRLQSGCLGKVVIGFFGSFRQGKTFNTLIEYASGGTLEDFLQKNDPPTDAEDIHKLWSAIFELTKAIQSIHSLSQDEGGPPILQGWHQDIKPSNILVTPSKTNCSFDVQFKLADLGLAHFRRIKSGNREEADRDTQGTRIYGAPECYRFDYFDRNQKLDVKQSVDIWSLGCVYSEIAVWVVLGKGALVRYQRDRREETAEMNDFTDHGCFHNGETVLECVKDIHNKVFSSTRESDHITKAVIRKLLDEMLDDFEGRPNARQLRKKAQTILTNAEQAEAERNNGGVIPSERQRGSNPNKGKSRRLPAKLPPDGGIHDWGGQASKHAEPRAMGKSQTFNFPEVVPSSPESSRRGSLESLVRDPAVTTHAPQDPGSVSRPTLRPMSASDPSSLNNENSSQSSALASEMDSLSLKHTSDVNGARGLGSGQSNTRQNTTGSSERPTVPNISSPSGNYRSPGEAIVPLGEGAQQGTLVPAPSAARSQEGALSTQDPTANGGVQAEVLKVERPQLPKITLGELENWVLRKKRDRDVVVPLEHKDEIMRELGLRDHVFLIDDAGSMRKYWRGKDSVIDLAKALAYIVKASDKDGMDLYFTCTEGKHNVANATTMESRLASKLVNSVAKSNMADMLGRITEEYEERLRRERSTPGKRKSFFGKSDTLKPLNIYVFTDAVWQPHCNVGEVITALTTTMKDLKYPRRQVGIQFIQFGNDPAYTEKLKNLDDAVGFDIPEGYDIVDTEPAVGGNCWKMLVGAINKWYDKG